MCRAAPLTQGMELSHRKMGSILFCSLICGFASIATANIFGKYAAPSLRPCPAVAALLRSLCCSRWGSDKSVTSPVSCRLG